MGTLERAGLVVQVAVGAWVLAGGSAWADPQPSIKVIATGSGCPSGSWSSDSNGSDVTLHFHGGSYVATVDADTPAARRACAASLVVEAPAGWQFTLGSVAYRGTARLAYGADASTTCARR
jgi:hypothetical protein